ncbi:uncharacterized protein LOC117320216 isoform X1 [Pecten maximus]|uniref:uncharacterized protein LOC117319523 isoform X1 n=1 Tax=Pecten maximus TaxID=6579 RepID=UPI0014584ECF|nr:uncharacterized protein LOC117319523 isoform X1 [Pecten maximus]XP_033730759.1 uncharacterized protein LOC117320216 isoform X1 [Pecten maximus]
MSQILKHFECCHGGKGESIFKESYYCYNIWNGNAQQLLTKLNDIHLTLTESSKRDIITGFGEEAEDRIIKDVCEGKDGKFNGDNLDIRVTTNDMRMDSQNKDYHFFATDFTLDRVSTKDYSQKKPIVEKIPPEAFLPSEEDKTQYRNSLKIILGRILSSLKGFSWIKSVLPDHIPHQFQADMAKVSKIHILPVSLHNEASYSDCVHIMADATQQLNHWYTRAGRAGDLDDMYVPFGGDQLTRVRLEGAKALRDGAHTRNERFDVLYPVIIEMFHTIQDFLEKMYKRLYFSKKGREIGTMAHIKHHIKRINVNGNVKSRFKAHEDFALTCGKAYFLAFILKHFKMQDINDVPCHPSLQETLPNSVLSEKTRVFHVILDEILDELLIDFPEKERAHKKVSLKVTVGAGTACFVRAKIQEGAAIVPLCINGKDMVIKIPLTSLERPCSLQLINPPMCVHFEKVVPPQDQLNDYMSNFLQWYFVIIQFKDIVHEGDIFRLNCILKHMIPFFFSHSVLSKYMTELIDYIMNTEHTLSPQLALKVRAASFVNPFGGVGCNKAADLEKENQVKFLKSLIKSLGANKTERAIVNLTKAAPVIQQVNDNFDHMTEFKDIKTTHKVRSDEDDVLAIVKYLQKNKVWISQKRDISVKVLRTPFSFETGRLLNAVNGTVERLMRDLPVDDDEAEDTDDNE